MSENSSTFAPAKYNGVPNAMPTQNSCPYNSVDCPCTKDCPRHGKCCECVAHHRAHAHKLPFCLLNPEPQPKPLSPKLNADLRMQKLVLTVGKQTVPRKYIMSALGLKQSSRQTFISNYLKPAFQQGLINFAYPNSPNKPVQAYRLTANGMMLYAQLTGKDWL